MTAQWQRNQPKTASHGAKSTPHRTHARGENYLRVCVRAHVCMGARVFMCVCMRAVCCEWRGLKKALNRMRDDFNVSFFFFI